MAANEEIETKSHTNVFEHVFGVDSVDCRFQFVDAAANEIKEYAAHQKVLGAISPVFATMFNETWNKNPKAITIEDASFEAFDAFMDFFYKEKVELSADTVAGMLYLADKYNVVPLFDHCEAFMIRNISGDNALESFSAAVQFERDGLKNKCEQLFGIEYDEILKAKSFNQCDRATLAAFLRALPRFVQAETVFDACIKWSQENCRQKELDVTSMKNLRAEMGECFELIHFDRMDYDDFITRYKSYKLLFTRDEFEDISIKIHSGMRDLYRLEPVDRRKVKFSGAMEYKKVNSVPTEILFNLSKPVKLYGITASRTCSSGVDIDFTAVVNVFRKKERIFTELVQFDKDKRHFIFSKKIIIAPEMVHRVRIVRILPTLTVNGYAVNGYTHKRQNTGDVLFIPREVDGSECVQGAHCSIESIEFLDFDI